MRRLFNDRSQNIRGNPIFPGGPGLEQQRDPAGALRKFQGGHGPFVLQAFLHLAQ